MTKGTESSGLLDDGSLEEGAVGEVETKFAPKTALVPNPLFAAGFIATFQQTCEREQYSEKFAILQPRCSLVDGCCQNSAIVQLCNSSA